MVRWRRCTFKNLDNTGSNPCGERKVEKGKESENRKKTVIKGEKLNVGEERIERRRETERK